MKIKRLLLILGCIIILCFVIFTSKSRAAIYTVPKASEQPKGKTFMYSKPVTLHDKAGHKVIAKEYTATDGKKYIQ